jgi:hypothetical protein
MLQRYCNWNKSPVKVHSLKTAIRFKKREKAVNYHILPFKLLKDNILR